MEILNFESFSELFQIFIRNNWTGYPMQRTALDNFVKLLINLNEKQRELILELTNRYSWLSANEIEAKLTNSLNKVEIEKLTASRRIIVFPIMKPEDEEKVKSGHGVIYKIRGLIPFLKQYENLEIKEIIKYDEIISESFVVKSTDLIFLVDDYLGSGETIQVTIENILKNRNINLNQINIITIASQNDTIKYVENLGISIYYDHIEMKGITDFNSESDAVEKKNIMLEIEKLIPGSSLFQFGYKQSEALITLTRTPDNTFPIFWKDFKKNGVEYKAPFPRY